MPAEDDELAAAAVAAWCADRGDRVPVSSEAPLAVTDDDAAAGLAAAGVAAVAEPRLGRARDGAVTHHPAHSAGGPHAAAALLPRDVVAAGDHLEALVAGAAMCVGPGGVVVLAAPAPFGHGGGPGVPAQALARAVAHTGLAVIDQLAPGAAGRLAGAPGRLDPAADRTPGLLDAGPITMCVGRRWREGREREQAFFSSLPRKVAAAAVLCRDDGGRVLCVHDAFKRRWTLPGGVVDADEPPDDAARREAAEEAGVDVELGALLGVFAAAWPDRLTFVYAASARGDPAGPVHAHEIDALEWFPVETAQRKLVAYVAEQVRCCLDRPGGTWRQSIA